MTAQPTRKNVQLLQAPVSLKATGLPYLLNSRTQDPDTTLHGKSETNQTGLGEKKTWAITDTTLPTISKRATPTQKAD